MATTKKRIPQVGDIVTHRDARQWEHLTGPQIGIVVASPSTRVSYSQELLFDGPKVDVYWFKRKKVLWSPVASITVVSNK